MSPGTRVIAHWPGLPAKLSGKVIGIEHGKYYVEYDDGDKHHNTIDQLRILKPPMYFGKFAFCLRCTIYTTSVACVNCVSVRTKNLVCGKSLFFGNTSVPRRARYKSQEDRTHR